MRTAQWIFFSFLAALLCLGGGYALITKNAGPGDPATPDRGILAPVQDLEPTLMEVVRLQDPPGRILDLDADDPRMAVLTRNGWYLHPHGNETGWSGEETVGAPRWLSSPESIALSGDRILILEPERSILSVWDTAGTRLGEIPIPVRRDLAQRATRVITGPAGRPVVVLQGMDKDGTAYWEVVELDGDGGITGHLSLPSTEPTAIFQEPHVAARGPALLTLSTLSQTLWAVDLEHNQLHPIAERNAPPLWRLPRSERRKHDQVLARMSGAMAAVAQLPEHWPSVREFTVRTDGTILQSTAAGETTIQVERLTANLEPLGRANRDGFADPVFLADGRAFLAKEMAEETVIYEILF